MQRGKNRSRQRRLDFVTIFIGSRNICAQTWKLSWIAPIFARFLLSKILKKAVPPKVVRALTPQLKSALSAKVSSGYTY